MKSFKEMALDTVNEHVNVEKLYDALDGRKSDEFISALYDWFAEFYPEAPLYGGEDVPDDFIEYLELKNEKKLREFYIYVKKKGLI